MIDLYYWPTPNGWKITIMLEECGLPYRIVPVNLGAGDQFKPEFLKISPNNRMPAIVDPEPPARFGAGPVSVFESGAILRYLGERTGQFWPADPRLQLQADEWLYWQVGNLGPMAGQHSHFWNYAPEGSDYAKARYAREYDRTLGVLDTWLADREFILGAYSVADMASFPWVLIAKAMGRSLHDFPHLTRWRAAVKARPAVIRGVDAGKALHAQAARTEESRKRLFEQDAAAIRSEAAAQRTEPNGD
ncbi:MAG: glutathione S-transferase N-terminal domain-containing protein [Pseudomonadota bacterium]